MLSEGKKNYLKSFRMDLKGQIWLAEHAEEEVEELGDEEKTYIEHLI